MNETYTTNPAKGCGCTTLTSKQTSPSCGCSSAPTISAARYDEDGNCAKMTSISCETQWQMRDCLKFAVCEFMVCVADELCVDGKFEVPQNRDLGQVLLSCLGDTVCTVLTCLPNAVCGPTQTTDCTPPPPALECNFAVEDKD